VAVSHDPADRLAQRYGGPGAWGRTALLAAGAVVVAALVGWFVWAIWLHSHPKVVSSMDSWKTHGPNEVTVSVDVHLYDAAAHPFCTVVANAEDHTVVGSTTFTPISGRQTITFRTEREATAVDWRGCVAKGQKDPQ
jgi:hypothetical protein